MAPTRTLFSSALQRKDWSTCKKIRAPKIEIQVTLGCVLYVFTEIDENLGRRYTRKAFYKQVLFNLFRKYQRLVFIPNIILNSSTFKISYAKRRTPKCACVKPTLESNENYYSTQKKNLTIIVTLAFMSRKLEPQT